MSEQELLEIEEQIVLTIKVRYAKKCGCGKEFPEGTPIIDYYEHIYKCNKFDQKTTDNVPKSEIVSVTIGKHNILVHTHSGCPIGCGSCYECIVTCPNH